MRPTEGGLGNGIALSTNLLRTFLGTWYELTKNLLRKKMVCYEGGCVAFRTYHFSFTSSAAFRVVKMMQLRPRQRRRFCPVMRLENKSGEDLVRRMHHATLHVDRDGGLARSGRRGRAGSVDAAVSANDDNQLF